MSAIIMDGREVGEHLLVEQAHELYARLIENPAGAARCKLGLERGNCAA